MGFGFKNFFQGIKLVPNSTSQVSVVGDIEVLASNNNKINYFNGSSASPVVTETHADQGSNRLQNKDLDASNVDFVDPSDTTKQVDFSISSASTSTATTLKFQQTANRTITFPDQTTTLVGGGTSDYLQNKQLDDSTVEFVDPSDHTKQFGVTTSAATTNTKTNFVFSQTANRNINVFDASDTLVGRQTTDTLSNKTIPFGSNFLTGSSSSVVVTNGSGVATTVAQVSKAQGGTGADNSNVTFPSTGVIVTEAAVETLTNKTLSTGTSFSTAPSFTEISTPSNPSSGSLKFYPKTDGNFYSLNSSGAESQIGGLAVQSPQRNFLINSAGAFWQRGTSITISNGTGAYQGDRFYAWNSLGSGGVLTYAQVSPTLAQSIFGFSTKVSTAPGSSVAFGINWGQSIDNITSMQLYNQTASLSMQVKALGNVNQVTIAVGYVTSEAKFGITSGLPTTIISSQTVSVNSSTFSIGQLPNVAMGTSVTTSGSYFVVCYVSGVSTGHVSDLNNGFVVEQPMLNIGSACASFATAGANAQEEFAMCQRYYERGFFNATGVGISTTAIQMYPYFKVTKRINASVSLVSGASLSAAINVAGSNGSFTPSSLSTATGTVSSAALNWTCVGGTNNAGCYLNTDIIQADSEI